MTAHKFNEASEEERLLELQQRLEHLELIWLKIRLQQLRTRLLPPEEQFVREKEGRSIRSVLLGKFFISFFLTFLVLSLFTLLDTKETFETRQELVDAVDEYLQDPSPKSLVAGKYGWPIGQWKVSKIQDFHKLFDRNRNKLVNDFNEDIGNWDMSNATNLDAMFNGAAVFNQDLSRWDVSKVKSAQSLFDGALVFNSNISAWNVSSLETAQLMFSNAQKFNQDISQWPVTSLTNLACMFCAAESFQYSLCAWSETLAKNKANTQFMFHLSGCPTREVPDLKANPKGPFCRPCRE